MTMQGGQDLFLKELVPSSKQDVVAGQELT